MAGNGNREARTVVEAVIGRKTTSFEEVHHIDGDDTNNRNNNLVLCPSCSYHKLLHVREAALKGCGNVHWRKCYICKQYDDPKNLVHYHRNAVHHRECMNKKKRDKRADILFVM